MREPRLPARRGTFLPKPFQQRTARRRFRSTAISSSIPKWRWAWVIDEARLLAEPVVYQHPRGAQAWVTIGSATALRIGIANHVVPRAELVGFAIDLAAAIAEGDRGMVAAMRADWQAANGTPIEEARRIHEEHARRGGFTDRATATGIAAHRDGVLERSRRQRPLP